MARAYTSLRAAAALALAACSAQYVPPATHAAAAPAGAAALGYRVVHSFGKGKDAHNPFYGALIAVNGVLYGAASAGNVYQYNHGAVFRLQPAGKDRVLYDFGNLPDGVQPWSGLVYMGGKFYGTTLYGGKYGDTDSKGGTVFWVDKTGTERVLHSFGKSGDGALPYSTLLASGGVLYGTTQIGGKFGHGTVFSLTTSGAERILHSFGSNSYDGGGPRAGLVTNNGTLYGTTPGGGPYFSGGTIFSVRTDGTNYVILHYFGAADSTFIDGSNPYGPLLYDHGRLYGTATGGGAGGYYYNRTGIVFELVPNGSNYTVLHNFGIGSDGYAPYGGVVRVAGTLYGTTQSGGKYNYGTVYSIASDGTEQVLHSFKHDGADGNYPLSTLFDLKGVLYGTTEYGGKYDDGGTVFAVKP